MRPHLLGFAGYAPGAIKTRDHLLDIVIEARKSKRAIRLYAVGQGGYFQELFLTSRSKIDDGKHGIALLRCWARSSFGGARYYHSDPAIGDYNVSGKGSRGGHNRHQLFSNRRAALAYSTALKNDASYQQAVKDWHRHCDELWGQIWS